MVKIFYSNLSPSFKNAVFVNFVVFCVMICDIGFSVRIKLKSLLEGCVMKDFLVGIIYSLLIVLSFSLLRNVFELWTAFILSLVIPIIVFIIYTIKKNANLKSVVMNSLGTGFFYIVFASIGIALFPKEQIRDLGDIVMPYINALIFGVCAIVVFICFGFTLIKRKI